MRFSPTLANKPKSNKPRHSNEKLVDPFASPPKGLFIADLPTHNLVLNKFPVIPDHFILATKDFKEQTDLLEEDDLGAAYECFSAYRQDGEELFGFFNSGEHSGASQRHRHLQFLPVESMRIGIEKGQSWDVMADSLTRIPRPGMFPVRQYIAEFDSVDLPFLYFSHTVPKDASSKTLHEIYTKLHKNACQLLHTASAGHACTKSQPPMSYNLGLTDQVMVLCPRAAEGIKLRNTEREDIGFVALNGTVLGGTLLVKNEAEYVALRNDQSKLVEILSAIGFSPTQLEHDQKL